MAKIVSTIGKQLYRMEVISKNGNNLIADEPNNLGGQNLGFSPDELLAASLATCTSATLRMYGNRKNWDVGIIRVEVNLESSLEESSFERKILFENKLTNEQNKRLLQIAEKCPIHKILSQKINIKTIISDD
jgi:putative redox protein